MFVDHYLVCLDVASARRDSAHEWTVKLVIEQLVQTEMIGHNTNRVMSSTFNSEIDPSQPLVYQIRIEDLLGREWADWFGRLK